MNTPLIVVTTAVLFLLAFSSSILIVIVIRRVLIQFKERRIRALSDRIERDILQVMSKNDKRLTLQIARKYRFRPRMLVRVLIGYMETFEGREREHLKLIYETSVRRHLARDMTSLWIYRRLRATRPFVLFAGPEDTESVIKLLKDKPIIRLAAINALSRSPNQHTIKQIFQAFEGDPDPNIRAYLNVMHSLGDDIEKTLQTYLYKQLSVEKLGLLIELVGSVPMPRLYADIIPLGSHEDKEIRIRVARALGKTKLAVPEVAEALVKLMGDEAWEVTAQAIKGLENLQIMSALDLIMENLYSPHWHCRLNAGYALSNMGPKGIERLEAVAAQTKDRYAAEMAQMVLEDIIHFQKS